MVVLVYGKGLIYSNINVKHAEITMTKSII